MGEEDKVSGMSEVKRAQYKAYKELKQRIERERQLAVVAAFAVVFFWMTQICNQQRKFQKTKHDENAIQIYWIGDTTMIIL